MTAKTQKEKRPLWLWLWLLYLITCLLNSMSVIELQLVHFLFSANIVLLSGRLINYYHITTAHSFHFFFLGFLSQFPFFSIA